VSSPHDHAHEHDHDHARGLLARVRALFVPHSHDPSDSVDLALESSERGIRALKVSLGVLAATAVLQAVLVVVTGSVALLGDTLHNVADALTALPLWLAFTIGRRPPTRRYTYGYGRAEDLAGVAIVAMILLSAVVAGYEAVRRLLDPVDVRHVGAVAAAAVVGFLGNEVVAQYRIRVGRDIGSAALVADGLHARTDGFTSLAVLVGAIGVWMGHPLADPIVGLLITLAIAVVLKNAARDVYLRLMDAVDESLVTDTERSLANVFGVEEVTEVRIRWIGHTHPRLHPLERAAMVVRANKHEDGIGGHISTYASAATLYEVGFNHFFRGKDDGRRRRPDLLPGPRLARHLRARVPRGPAHEEQLDQLPPRARRRAGCRRTRTRG
jgi:cation diffusion facilitator family transporter